MSKKKFLLLSFFFVALGILSAPLWKHCELHGDALQWGVAQPTSSFSPYAIQTGDEMPHANRFYVAYTDSVSWEEMKSKRPKLVWYCRTCRELEAAGLR